MQFLQDLQSRLPTDWTPWLPELACAAIALALIVLGQMVIWLGGRRRNPEDAHYNPRRGLVFGPLTWPLSMLLPQSRPVREELEKELKRAGYYRPYARHEFLAIRNSLVIGWALVIASLALVAYDPNNDRSWQFLAAGLIGVAAMFGLPRLWLQSAGNRRVQRIQTGLPDALDMTNMCLTGGLPLQPALERVSREIRHSHADLSQELDIVRRQAETYTMEQALAGFADRIDVPEIRSLTAMVTQAERLGSNVARALGEYADSLRRTHRQRAEERGNAASIKLLLPVALCLAPPVYILLLAPPLFQMREFVVRENRPGGILTPIADPNARSSPDFIRRYGNLRPQSEAPPQN